MNESPTIYTDLDGTLLDHETYSAEAARAVLHSLTEQGIPIVPATSKPYSQVSEFRREMGPKHASLVENGAALIRLLSRNFGEQDSFNFINDVKTSATNQSQCSS